MTPSHFVCSITQVGKKFGGIIFRMTFVLAGPHSVTIQNNNTDGYRIRISFLMFLHALYFSVYLIYVLFRRQDATSNHILNLDFEESKQGGPTFFP
jgi:hypothetical protein